MTTERQRAFPAGHGEIHDLIRSFDWTGTSLGPIENWPQSLKTATDIMLQSNVPMTMLWGDEGIMIYNDAYSIFAGARHPRLFGSKVLEGWPEVADFNAYVMEVGLRGETLSYVDQQLTLYRNDVPEAVWMNLNYSPVMDESGKPAGVLAIVVETTQRVQTEQRLTRTRGQLDSALAVGLISTWSWDMRKDIVIGDKNLAQTFGVTATEVANGLPLKVFINSIHPDDQQRVSSAISQAVSAGSDYEIEYRTVTTAKKTIWVIARGQVQKDEHGNPTHFLGILIDITERRVAQQQLEETKQMFDALFGSSIVAIVLANTSGKVLQANKTFSRMFGYTESDITKGLTSAQLTPKGQVKVTESIYDSLRRTGEAEPIEKVYLHKDGSEVPALVGGALLPGSKDTFMAFILDISENQRLKQLNSTKDEFIALASHQLRTPASTVKQYLGILLQGLGGELTEKQCEYIDRANKANERQLTIIDDLLKTAQIDAKGYSVSLLPKNIVSIVEAVMADHESTAKARDQKIICKTEHDTIVVPVDESELNVCFSNLVENALKYSPAGSTINLDLKVVNNQAQFSVSDQGIGIDQKDQRKIFDKFTRVTNGFSDTVNGNGLGLYWVKRIIDIHNGTIDVKSSLGKGTRFVVKLPI